MQWMIYGANGYTGQLIARAAVRMGMSPVLAGRNATQLAALAGDLGLPHRVFGLDDSALIAAGLDGMKLVLHCAGPFSATSAAMIEGCLASRTHYLDITGEVPVFEHAHDPAQARRAREAGIVLCPGVGFDVIPTDCVALKLKQELPYATHLSLGFDSDSGLSPGTARTLVEFMAHGGIERRDSELVAVPFGNRSRLIDFGRGRRRAMTIPWGDVSTAFYTTGIANIDTWIPAPAPLVAGTRLISRLRPLLASAAIQSLLKWLVNITIKGPSERARQKHATWVWGEARDDSGQVATVRIRTANGYSLTVSGSLAVVRFLLNNSPQGGSYTPAMLMGESLVESLPGSGQLLVD